MHYVAPLISEAWEAYRRRRVRLLIAAAVSVLGAAVIWGAAGGLGSGAGGGGSSGSLLARPSAVLARPPYMGVVCHPNSSSCHRVGLAVWLKRPALSVIATSAGVSASLNEADRSGIQIGSVWQRREFIGFFKPAGIVPRSYMRTPDAIHGVPTAAVTLRIVTGRGQTLITHVRVPVEAGWG